MENKRFLKVLAMSILMFSLTVSASLAEMQTVTKEGVIKVTRYGNGYRFDRNGWIYVHIEGTPYERGFHHGYLVASELEEIMENMKYLTYWNTGKEWKFFVSRIDTEFLEEIKGIAEGAQSAGTEITWEEVLAWNGYFELSGYWWPNEKAGKFASGEQTDKDHCSAFIATGSATMDMKSFQEAKDVTSLHHRLGDRIITLSRDWPYLHWTYVYGPAGGINSNISDMAKWLKFQVNNGVFDGRPLITEENMNFMHTPKTIAMLFAERREYYCQAWMYRENAPYPIVWHNGGTTGCKTMVAIVPEAKVGIVVLSNLIDSMLPEALAFRFFDMYLGSPDVDWSREMLAQMKETMKKAEANLPVRPEDPLPPMSLEKYVGDYRNDVYGQIDITEKNGGLVLAIGPNKVKMYL